MAKSAQSRADGGPEQNEDVGKAAPESASEEETPGSTGAEELSAPPGATPDDEIPFHLVGIGASAGGLAAFEGFFTHMPADSGLAFVLVQHLDPTHKSILGSLIGQYTSMPVAEVEVDFEVMEAFIGRPISGLDALCDFWKAAGYDYALLQVRGQWLSDSFQIKVSEGLLHGDVHDTASTFAGAGVTDQAGFEAYPWIGPEGLYLRDVDLIEGIMPDGMKLVVTVGPIFSGVEVTQLQGGCVARFAFVDRQ